MSDEEIVPQGDIYEYPDAYLTRLNQYQTNGPKYSIVQGALYEWLQKDVRATDKEAMNVSQLLNQGKIEDAEDLIGEVLEE